MSRSTHYLTLSALVAALASGCAGVDQDADRGVPAQTMPARIDVSALGPQVGDEVPDFSLSDQSGKRWTRSSILGPQGAMLVFFRSADW